MPSRIVCIANSTGSGGETVARIVAERLGYRLVDEEIITRAAEKEGIDPEVVADAEKRKSFLARYLEELGEAAGLDQAYAYGALGVPAVAGAHGPHGTSEGLRGLIRDAIRETADEGDVVIVSHGASVALAGRPEVLRVFVTASPEIRVARLVALNMDERDAAKAVKDEDASRADYFKRFYRLDQELPTHYDLVLSTDVLSEEQVAELVEHAARL